MARIRSIHPGQWTHENFVSLSFAERLLAIALRNEADDWGLFEWRPLRLKMRMFPADNVDVAELLSELEQVGLVRRYEVDGRPYGAIRNFCRWQTPKKPRREHPVTPEIAAYTGADQRYRDSGPDTEPDGGEHEAVRDEFRTGSEPVPNRSGNPRVDGEGRGEGGGIRRETPSSYEGGGESPAPDGALPADAGPSPPRDRIAADQIREAVETWNRICGDVLPRVVKLTEARRRQLRRRLADDCGGDLQEWEAYCRRIRATPFLCGANDRGWRADFDFALRPSSWAKVMEGRYDGAPGAPRPPPSARNRDPFMVAMERVRRRMKLAESDDDDRTILAGARPGLSH